MQHEIHYTRLIAKAQERPRPDQPTHLHHILPRSLGGLDDASNLVYLTIREHFIAHLLLAHISPNQWFSVELLAQQCGLKLKKWQRRRISWHRAHLQRASRRIKTGANLAVF